MGVEIFEPIRLLLFLATIQRKTGHVEQKGVKNQAQNRCKILVNIFMWLHSRMESSDSSMRSFALLFPTYTYVVD